MFSIGILGCLVWSWLGLPHSDIGVINLAICWNSFTLLGTFYSKNPNSNTQSAGNHHFLNVGPSETTHDTSHFNFTPFYALYSKLGYTNVISQEWLAWFIGFAEGDGAILSYNGRPTFVLTQKEGAILYHIQSILGFGTVRQSGNYYCYFVEDLKGVILLCLLFNGNLVLQHRIIQLSKWIDNINNSLSNLGSRYYNFTAAIVHNIIPFVPTLADAWISGFTDAEELSTLALKRELLVLQVSE